MRTRLAVLMRLSPLSLSMCVSPHPLYVCLSLFSICMFPLIPNVCLRSFSLSISPVSSHTLYLCLPHLLYLSLWPSPIVCWSHCPSMCPMLSSSFIVMCSSRYIVIIHFLCFCLCPLPMQFTPASDHTQGVHVQIYDTNLLQNYDIRFLSVRFPWIRMTK